MASMTAGGVPVATLIDWGVNAVFGLPGDGINGVIEALRKRKDEIGFIQLRHEKAAALRRRTGRGAAEAEPTPAEQVTRYFFFFF